MIKKMFLKYFPEYSIKRSWHKRGHTYYAKKLDIVEKMMYDWLADLCLCEYPKTILEYGCGHGYLLKNIEERNKTDLNTEYYGIDYSQSQIENAREYFPNGIFHEMDITNNKDLVQFEEKRFDVVIGVSILMYIVNRQINAAISNLNDLCKNKIFLIEYCYEYLTDKTKRDYEESTAHDGRRIHDYEDLLYQNGFKNIHTFPIQYYHDTKININNAMPLTLVTGDK